MGHASTTIPTLPTLLTPATTTTTMSKTPTTKLANPKKFPKTVTVLLSILSASVAGADPNAKDLHRSWRRIATAVRKWRRLAEMVVYEGVTIKTYLPSNST